MPIFFLKTLSGIWYISLPSRYIEFFGGLNNLVNSLIIVLFPSPVLPTIANVSPEFIENEIPSNTT